MPNPIDRVIGSAIQMSTRGSGNANDAGITPMTSAGIPARITGRPMMPGSPPYRRIHSPCESTAQTWRSQPSFFLPEPATERGPDMHHRRERRRDTGDSDALWISFASQSEVLCVVERQAIERTCTLRVLIVEAPGHPHPGWEVEALRPVIQFDQSVRVRIGHGFS